MLGISCCYIKEVLVSRRQHVHWQWCWNWVDENVMGGKGLFMLVVCGNSVDAWVLLVNAISRLLATCVFCSVFMSVLIKLNKFLGQLLPLYLETTIVILVTLSIYSCVTNVTQEITSERQQ